VHGRALSHVTKDCSCATEQRQRTIITMPDQDIGTLYVLSNRDQSLAKIGLTRDGTPDARATDYERAHGIRWHVYWSAATCNVAEAEAAAHRELDIRRFALVPGAREVFHVTPQKAKRVAARYVVPPSGAPQQPDAGTERSAWFDYGDVLVSVAFADIIRVATSRISPNRYGRVLSQLFTRWLAFRRRPT
jgi:hypothetical protein